MNHSMNLKTLAAVYSGLVCKLSRGHGTEIARWHRRRLTKLASVHRFNPDRSLKYPRIRGLKRHSVYRMNWLKLKKRKCWYRPNRTKLAQGRTVANPFQFRHTALSDMLEESSV